MSTYRILVTGSRDWEDWERIVRAICVARNAVQLPIARPTVIVHGACPTGADEIAGRWARCNTHLDMTEERHPAEWDRYGKSAGFRRNAVMVAAGADICLAFIRNGSKGATHTADLAEKAGIETRRFLA